ncbi:glycosyltransferase family 2 protein [Companilactobacillus metriopterae]|uniref:glycosyltransferase family 2 protein n=1 Tax=Companilactobacillus metriopterae TaxID=1909267 RepID=UPI00100AE288|nr:glycosyltransferase family 2 protein [Companilactobacillus metriopterae]
MENIKISIIMTIYNVHDYLEKSIESIINQNNSNFNLIMVDDCSTDGSSELAQKYADKYDFIQLIKHSENRGVSAARNTGMDNVETELITFVDSDDWVEENYVDYFLRQFKDNDVDMVTCGFTIENGLGKSKPKSTKEISEIIDREEMIKRITKISDIVMGYTWNKVYKMSIIQENNLRFSTDLNLMEDQVFNVEYSNNAQEFYISSIPLYHYVNRKDSITKKFAVDNVKDVGLAKLKVYQLTKKTTEN